MGILLATRRREGNSDSCQKSTESEVLVFDGTTKDLAVINTSGSVWNGRDQENILRHGKRNEDG